MILSRYFWVRLSPVEVETLLHATQVLQKYDPAHPRRSARIHAILVETLQLEKDFDVLPALSVEPRCVLVEDDD